MAVRSAEVVGRTSHVGRIGALAVAIGVGLAAPLGSGIAWASPGEVDSFSTEPEPTVGTLDDGAPEHTTDEPDSPTPAPPSDQQTSTADAEPTNDGDTAGESVTAKTVEVAPGVTISSSGGAQTSSDHDTEPIESAVPAEPAEPAEPAPEAVPAPAPAEGNPAPAAPVAPPRPPVTINNNQAGHGYEWLHDGTAPAPPAVQNTGRGATRISVTAVPDIEPALGDTARATSLPDQPQWAGMSTSVATGVTDATDPPEPQSSALKRVGLIVGVLGLFGVTPGTPVTPGGGVAPVLQLAWAWRRDAARAANTTSMPTPARPVTDGNCEPLTCATNGAMHGVVTFADGSWNVDGSWTNVPTAHALHAASATDAPTATTTDTFTVSIVEESGVTTEVPINISLLSPISAATAEVQRIPVGNGPSNVTVGLDGRYVYVPHAMESTLGVLDSWTGSVTYLDTAAPVGRAELTADGSRLYAANGSNGSMTVVDTTTNLVVSTVAVGGYASDFVLDAKGDRACVLVNAPDDGFELVVIDTATDTVIGRAHLGPDADLPAISPDGGTLFIRDSIGRSIRAVDTATFSSTDISADWHVTQLAVGPDGRHLFASAIPDLHVYDTETKALVRTLADLGGARFLVFSPDGSKLYTANLDGDTLAVIDTATFAHETVKIGSNPVNAAVSTDGRQLFLLNGDGTVSVLDTLTEGADTVDIHGRPNDLFQIALSPDGKHVYIPQYETGTLAVISARTANLTPTVDVDQVDEPGSGAVTYTVSGVDADGDELVYTVVPLAPGALTDLGGGRFRFVPDTALSGHLPPGVHDALSVTVSDGHGGSRAVRGTHVVAPYAEATVVDTFTVGGEVRSVAVSPDGSTAYIPIIDPGGRSRVEVLDTASGDLLAIVALADDPRGIASLNTDGSRLVVPGGEYVMIIDTTTFEVIAALEGADHAVLDPDGLKAYTLRASEMSIHDVNPGSAGFGTRIGAIPTGGHAEGMATGPDGRVYFATSDFVVTAVDTVTDRVVGTISTTSGSHNLTAAPGRLYAPLHGTSLAILDTDAAVVAANIPIRVESPGPYVTATTDGSRVYLSRREEGILSVFDPATDTIIASVRVGDGTVAPAAVSADGSLVAVPAGDSVTIIATGRNIEV